MSQELKTVLIVDDEPDTAEMLEQMLMLSGYQVKKAFGSASSMNMISHDQPDALILDLSMPDISGLEVLRFIRRDPRLLHIPVIIVTARGLPVDIRIGLEAGADVYLTKPVSFAELRSAVDLVVGQALHS